MLDAAGFTFEFDLTMVDYHHLEVAQLSYVRGYLLIGLIATLIIDAMRNRLLLSACWLIAEKIVIRPLARFVNWCYVRIRRPRAWVRLDEHGLIYVTRPNRRIHERSMSQILSAKEFDAFFAFRSTLGIFCIPKRVFAADVEAARFRSFVRACLVARCHFETSQRVDVKTL